MRLDSSTYFQKVLLMHMYKINCCQRVAFMPNEIVQRILSRDPSVIPRVVLGRLHLFHVTRVSQVFSTKGDVLSSMGAHQVK